MQPMGHYVDDVTKDNSENSILKNGCSDVVWHKIPCTLTVYYLEVLNAMQIVVKASTTGASRINGQN